MTSAPLGPKPGLALGESANPLLDFAKKGAPVSISSQEKWVHLEYSDCSGKVGQKVTTPV